MIQSPCIGQCKIEQVNQQALCIGCQRTREELSHWMRYTDQQRQIIMQQCVERKQALQHDD